MSISTRFVLGWALWLCVSPAQAQDFAPTRATSVRIVDADSPVFLAARDGAPRRGTIALGTHLPLLGRVRGGGCPTGVWAQVGESLYICDRRVEYTTRAASGFNHPRIGPGELLPFNYGFVSSDGVRAFSHPQDYFTDDYYEALGAGFGVIVAGQETYEGLRFIRTRRRLYIPAQSVRLARGSDFAGVSLEENEGLNVAWVSARQASVRERPRGPSVRTLAKRTAVRISTAERGWVELADGGFVRTRDLTIAERTERPEEVEENGTWIDVDVSSQILVAYRGDTPVFTTLVSSGRSGRHHATPMGTHRIWVKLAFSDMDNLQRQNVSRNYAIEQVPWVQYFEGANGLHAAFWHDDFGRRKSHGCINLSPRDARTLFEFTEPSLPVGWTAIFPRDDEPTTYVHIHP